MIETQITTSTLDIRDEVTKIYFLRDSADAELTINLSAPNSKFIGIIIFVGQAATTLNLKMTISHQHPNTYGHFYLRSALYDQSTIHFSGNVKIPQHATGCDSYLSHHSLMLAKSAKTETIPCLEIETADVKAGHAASIGHLEDELLFYLASRGLNQEEATEALIKGFLEADLKYMDNNQAIKDQIAKL